MENDVRFREELRLMAARLREENEALLKLIRELNRQTDIRILTSKQNKPKTIRP